MWNGLEILISPYLTCSDTGSEDTGLENKRTFADTPAILVI